MTPQELTLFRELNVLAETDAVLATTMYCARMGHMSQTEAFMAGLKCYSGAIASLRSQLLDAISTRPRIYYLGPGELADVCAPPRQSATPVATSVGTHAG